jgi:hypothetical protein
MGAVLVYCSLFHNISATHTYLQNTREACLKWCECVPLCCFDSVESVFSRTRHCSKLTWWHLYYILGRGRLRKIYWGRFIKIKQNTKQMSTFVMWRHFFCLPTQISSLLFMKILFNIERNMIVLRVFLLTKFLFWQIL